MKWGVVLFPGSLCERDAFDVIQRGIGDPVRYIWHKETELSDIDCVILPGGFTYGDYLRVGAMAAHSPVMKGVKTFSERGGLVCGICNGFQILVESHLLPGALVSNRCLNFLCRDVFLRVETAESPFSNQYRQGQVIRLPIAHQSGSYVVDDATYQELLRGNRIVFRYSDPRGEVRNGDSTFNPNGSMHAIAGVLNEKRNVLGLMPHPERAGEAVLGGADGLKFFTSVREFFKNRR